VQTSPNRALRLRTLTIRLAGPIKVFAGTAQSVLLLGILRPAALHARAVATALVAVLGWAQYFAPRGRRKRKHMSEAFPSIPEEDVGPLLRKKLALPYRQYAALVRRSAADEPVAIDQHMSADARDLLRSNRSLLVATGHFDREALLALYEPGVIPRVLTGVWAPASDQRPPMHAAAKHEMFETIVASTQRSRSSRRIRRSPGTFDVLLQCLQEPRGTVHIHVDAPVEREASHTFVRPFTWFSEQRFATGIARLARLAQAPILLCFAELEDDGRIVLRWSDPVAPPDQDDETADVRVTSALLDQIEREVGRHPENYLVPIDSERRWDAGAEQWVDRP
jgi:lauroyl/myristoyl acyltransferase